MNNFNKRAKTRSIIIAKIKNYIFNKRMRARLIINTKIKTNKASSKNNAACTIKDSGIVDACTSTDDLIVKKYVDACTSTDDLIVKKYVDACTSTDDVCTNENEPCTNENEPCTNENEPCTNDDDDDDDDDNNSDIGKLRNFGDKVLNKLINVSETRKEILINIKKILAIIDQASNISKNDLKSKLDEYRKLNRLVDDLRNIIWVLMYGKNRVNNEINNINADKEKDVNGYVNK